MLKPPSSAAPIPGMTDTLDFVKNLWGSMNIPGAGMGGMGGMGGMPGITGPALSTEDLDKRIADMKAVESWLNLNLTMLRGTIQAMEVQRGTLATLKTMGASMAEAMRQSGVSAEKMAAMPFAPFFGQSAAGTPAAAAPSAPPAAAARPASGGGSAQPGTGSAQGAPGGADAASAAPGMPAALAWWNMLQEQFTQAVASAMTPAPGAAAPASPPTAAATESPAAGKPAPAPQPETPSPEAGNGNGGAKPRVGRPKADKA